MSDRQGEARLRALVDMAVEGIILIDARGEVLIFNAACERLFGYAAGEIIGRNVKLLMPTPFREGHDAYIENYLRTGTGKIIGIGRETVGRRKDGTTFPIHLSVGASRQGDETLFVGIVHDLSGRRQAEDKRAQAQKMEAVGQLSGGVAHEFNNLLTVIMSNAESLGELLKAHDDLKRKADAIIAASERGAELTQRLLAFSRRQTLQPAAVDCNALIDRVAQVLRSMLRPDIEVRAVPAPALWRVTADASQLEAAILNLALNAQDAMPDGGRLTLATANLRIDDGTQELYPEVGPGRYVLIAVADDGEGMPPDVAGRAFEPFFTTKDVGRGSGLGLSMVYGFVMQSNGHVAIDSEPGYGTTVRICLPADANADAPA